MVELERKIKKSYDEIIVTDTLVSRSCKHFKQMNGRDDRKPLGIFILALSVLYLLG